MDSINPTTYTILDITCNPTTEESYGRLDPCTWCVNINNIYNKTAGTIYTSLCDNCTTYDIITYLALKNIPYSMAMIVVVLLIVCLLMISLIM